MPAKKSTTPKPRSSARELLFGDLWEYDPAPESAPAFIDSRYGLFIGGKMVVPKSKKYFDSISPRDGKKLSEIAVANAADVDAAYQAAPTAFKSWSKLPGKERGKYLFRIARLLQDRSREFAVAETLDGGKPIKESRDFDLPMAAAHFFYHAGWADKLDFVAPGRTLAPLGVVGQVIPWNFPLLMLAWKIAPALATGNTVVIKPAETTSITALKFASILTDAGLPPGVVNIVTGAGETGAAVVNHPLAAKIAFTGSTEVGKIIQRALAGSGKKLTLELGGKAANIVFEDAPLDQAVEGIINGIFFNQGHVCCAGSRLLVQEGIEKEILARLKRRLAVLRVGDPLDKNTDVGAINSKEQLTKIHELVQSGIKEGAEIHQPVCKLPKNGFYFPPTLFSGVAQSHRIANEEIFGPVLSILTFRTP
ncbi:MAG: aldehyde dehydrogenase family protein, partial [Akkermansiaceae bacterium]|nr:aldehyde dehydrogenase family protein [Akkermansiaceae bacterium]